METIMSARLVMFTVAMLAAGSALAAEPPKTPVKEAAQPAKRPAPVMLASAEQVPNPTPGDQVVQAPVKRRAARVTSCRCGDQVEEQPDQ
jgi:hypothetical protein